MIRAIGFDLDDTLFDHCAAATAGLAALIREHQWIYEGTTEFGIEWRRIEKPHFANYIKGNLTRIEQGRERIRDFLTLLSIKKSDTHLDELFGEYLLHYANSWIAYPDVRPTLDTLSIAGFRLAVLTNGQQEQQEAKLVRMGIRDMFESVLAIGTLSMPKPHAQAFLELCASLQCSPKEVMYVGDDPETDAAAATEAGLHGVWLNREGQETPVGIKTEIHSLASLITSIQQ